MLESAFHRPKRNGINLRRHLRTNSDNRFLPILMPISKHFEERCNVVKTAEVSAWIAKPFKPTQLVRIVPMILG